MRKAGSKNTELQLAIFFVSLVTPLALYLNRHLDDNRLTSWQWTFADISPLIFLVVLAIVLLVAWAASGFSLRKYRVLFLVIVSFVSSSLFWGEPETIVDASRYFTQAKQLKVYGVNYFISEWSKEVFAWTDLPLVPFLYGLVFKFFGEQRLFVQIVTTLSFSGTVILTFQLGKILWNEDVGFYGALLLLGFPYLFTQIPLMLVDVPTMFFLMLSLVSVARALQKGGLVWVVLAGFSLFLVFYAKYSTWLMLSVMPIIFVYFFLKAPSQTTKRGGVVAGLALSLIGIVLFFYMDAMVSQLEFLVSYQKPGLKKWGESYVSTFLFQVHPFVTAGAIVSLLVALKKKDWRYVIICYLVLLLIFMQVKRIRYTLPVFPMLALLASYGLLEINNRRILNQLVFSIVGTSLVVALIGFLPFLKTMSAQNLLAAGKYLDNIGAERAEVITATRESPVLDPAVSVALLDIYTEKELIYEGRTPSPQEMERAKSSPLRFTWEYPIPDYYKPQAKSENKPDAVVIIADQAGFVLQPEVQKRTEGLKRRKVFQNTSGVFQHQTFVAIYHK
jgi:hypothetical protein